MANLDIFNRSAAHYDTPERERIARICAQEILHALGESRLGSALDYGCGTGLVGLQLLSRFRRLDFADASECMLEVVRQKLSALSPEDRPVEDPEVLLLDLESGGAALNQYDCILLVQVLLHVPDTAALLRELRGLVAPQGRLIIIDFNENPLVASELVHPGFDAERLADQVAAAGFERITYRTFYEGENLFMGQPASLFLMDARLPG